MASSNYSVKVLAKGLAAMEALGRLGKASAAEIAAETQVPRPTAHRLLETLSDLGYVKRLGLREGYSLALRVRGLAQGCRDADWVAEIAEPVLARLGDEVVWPTDIATYQNGFMVVRATTHRRSPLSLERISAGRLITMLNSAIGRTYLAYCGEAERRVIVESLAYSPGQDGEDKWHPVLLQRDFEAIRERGYGIRIRGSQPKTSTIAVPVLAGGQVVACVNLIWIDSAVDLKSIVQQHLAPLQEAALEIGRAYHAATGSLSSEADGEKVGPRARKSAGSRRKR